MIEVSSLQKSHGDGAIVLNRSNVCHHHINPMTTGVDFDFNGQYCRVRVLFFLFHRLKVKDGLFHLSMLLT